MCYAPTNDATDDKKDEYYAKLQEVAERVARHDILACIGDFNATLGSSNVGFESCMGRMGVGDKMSDNGMRYASFCLANDLIIGGTLFKHKQLHKTTWVSPCGKYKRQIDHMAISKRHRSSLLDVRAKRGADIGSDHQLVVAKLRLKLKSQKKVQSGRDRYDVDLLRRDGSGKEEYTLECRNRFSMLELLEEEQMDINEMWSNGKQVLHEAAKHTIVRRQRTRRKKWMSDETWSVVEKRREARLKSEMCNGVDRDVKRAEYWSLHSEVRRIYVRGIKEGM